MLGDVAVCPYSKQNEYYVIVRRRGNAKTSVEDKSRVNFHLDATSSMLGGLDPRSLHRSQRLPAPPTPVPGPAAPDALEVKQEKEKEKKKRG